MFSAKLSLVSSSNPVVLKKPNNNFVTVSVISTSLKRLFVLQGPQEAQPVVKAAPKAQPDEISWGMGGQDAFEGDEWAGKDLVLGMVDRSTIEEDAFYLKEPRKALTLWLENKGAELEIAIQEDEDAEASTFTARIELPVPLH